MSCKGGRRLNTTRKILLGIALLAVLSFSASVQTDWGRLGGGPSLAQVAGAAVGAGAVIGIVLYLTVGGQVFLLIWRPVADTARTEKK
jgi:hypothetical protein